MARVPGDRLPASASPSLAARKRRVDGVYQRGVGLAGERRAQSSAVL